MINTTQYDVALSLASAHGHKWATAVSPSVWTREDMAASHRQIMAALGSGSGSVSLKQIEAVSMVYTEGEVDGIMSPDVDGRGHVVHTTGRRRLSWDIAPDGTTILTVERPAALAAELQASWREYDSSAVLARAREYDEWVGMSDYDLGKAILAMPGVAVLRATVCCGTVDVSASGDYAERHLFALAYALDALVDTATTDAALSPLGWARPVAEVV